MRLALNEWKASDSTVGAWATQSPIHVSDKSAEREIWLWDFGDQADQRLIHQLYIEDAALAVLVFDRRKRTSSIPWVNGIAILTRASKSPFAKLLAVGRVDAGGLRVAKTELQKFAAERGFEEHIFETSAKTGAGCSELKEAILAGIDWTNVPWRTSP